MRTLRSERVLPLRRFQDDFTKALFAHSADADVSPELALLAQQPAFAVYRNTVLKGCIDALQANYPSVARLVGDEWFRAAAAIYARANPPAQPMLLQYGQDFEHYLAAFAPADELPYLPGVARLDRFWTEAHTARDETPIDPHALAALDDVELMHKVLRPHASARWCWFDTQPIFTIWQRNRAPGPIDESEIDWHGEGALVLRTDGAVRWLGLDAAGYALFMTCADGGTLGDAAAAALAIDANVDPAALVVPLLDAGAFACSIIRSSPSEEPSA